MRGKERQGERHGKGTSAATTANLLGIAVQQGGCDHKEVAAMAGGGGLRRQLQGFNAGCSGNWFHGGGIAHQEKCRRSGTKRGNGNGDGNGNDASILWG
jgi:hypothetical protein